MFSIVIPLYNKALSITNTIESVLTQSFQDFEIVVVNDGSTDDSLDKVMKINDKRITVINKINGGVSNARNSGILEAKNKWIAFLDGDDIWLRDHLKNIRDMITEYPTDVLFCSNYVKSFELTGSSNDSSTQIIVDYFKVAINHHFLWTGVVVVNRSYLISKGLFDPDLKYGEDLDLWARLARDVRIIKSNSITAIYNQDAENRTSLTEYSFKKSFLSKLKFKGKRASERSYLKMLIKRRLFSLLKAKKIRPMLEILYKYHLKPFI